jgi:hypothetical protein
MAICETSAAVDLFEFGLGLGAADAVDGEAVVALKFLDGGAESISVGAVEGAGGIAEVVETGDLAGDFVDGVEMADFDGDDVVGEGGLIAADSEKAFFGVERNFLFEFAVAVGGELEGLAVDEEGTLGAGDGFFVDVFEDEAELESFFVDGESMLFVSGAGFLFLLHVGDENFITGEEDVGILAQLFQVGVVGMIPDDGVVGETVVFGDFGEMVALLNGVVVFHVCCLEEMR